MKSGSRLAEGSEANTNSPAGIGTPATSTSVVVIRGIEVCTIDSQRSSSSTAGATASGSSRTAAS